jgi:tetratricopeptide (TPR) repeat protein
MKKVIKLLLCILTFSIVCTQLILIAADLAGVTGIRQRSVSSLIYLGLVAVSGIFLIEKTRVPRLPALRLREVLETEGYSKEYYAVVIRWHDACIKRGYPTAARLTLAESLIDGGHTEEGLEILEKLEVNDLDRGQKQIYYNTLLYAAVAGGDREAADRIFEKAQPWLYTASSKAISASVKHTLGCYEYLCGNIKRAEALFMQALDSKPAADVICEVKMALTLCYLDTGRLELAREQADSAAQYAGTVPLQQKLDRTRRLSEEVFRQKLAGTA